MYADEPAFKQITSRRLCAEDFSVEKVIGRGAFGEVQLVRDTSTMELYNFVRTNFTAIKIIIMTAHSVYFFSLRYILYTLSLSLTHIFY